MSMKKYIGLWSILVLSLGIVAAIITLAGLVRPAAAAMPTSLPTSTPAALASGALTWNATVGSLFQTRCSICHGTALATNGLSFASYEDALKGAQDGVVIIPGNVDGSKLIVIQSDNNHPGQLSADELFTIKNWIAAGAPEK
jgi:mono/diheme cytochrome c family protein